MKWSQLRLKTENKISHFKRSLSFKILYGFYKSGTNLKNYFKSFLMENLVKINSIYFIQSFLSAEFVVDHYYLFIFYNSSQTDNIKKAKMNKCTKENKIKR